MSNVEGLRSDLVKIRARLEKGFSHETAWDSLQSTVPSAGHCAVVAAIIWGILGGSLVSANVNDISHWFNRIWLGDQPFDCDLTGDQFGWPAVQIKSAKELYFSTRERSPDDLSGDTLRRAVLLAQRAGLFEVAESLEKRRHSKKLNHSA